MLIVNEGQTKECDDDIVWHSSRRIIEREIIRCNRFTSCNDSFNDLSTLNSLKWTTWFFLSRQCLAPSESLFLIQSIDLYLMFDQSDARIRQMYGWMNGVVDVVTFEQGRYNIIINNISTITYRLIRTCVIASHVRCVFSYPLSCWYSSYHFSWPN